MVMDIESKFTKELGKVTLKATPHLVLVDDDPLFNQLVARVAQAKGIRLTTISSPEEAYRDLPGMQYDAALFDYDLGRVNGIQLTRYIGHSKPRVPVILVSHCRSLKSAENCPKSVVARLAKSVGADSILKAALSAVHAKRK